MPPSGVGPRRWDERLYERDIRRFILNPIMDSLRSGVAQAADAADALRILNAAGPGFILDEEGLAGAVKAAGDRTAAAHKRRFVQQFKAALKVDVTRLLNEDRIASYMMHWRERNIGLIKTIPPRLHDQLLRDVTEHFHDRPFDRGGLRQIVEQGGRSGGYNSRRIARDQTSKAVGQFNKMRQTDVGVESFIWRTSLDERVRDAHAALESMVFRWDSADEIPGEAIHCRCRAEPYQLTGGRALSDLRWDLAA